MSSILVVLLSVLVYGKLGVDAITVGRDDFRACTEILNGYIKYDGTSTCVDAYTDAACTNEKWLSGYTEHTIGFSFFSSDGDLKICNKSGKRRVEEERAAEEKRAAEQRAAEQRAAEKRAAEERIAEKRRAVIRFNVFIGIGAVSLVVVLIWLGKTCWGYRKADTKNAQLV